MVRIFATNTNGKKGELSFIINSDLVVLFLLKYKIYIIIL